MRKRNFLWFMFLTLTFSMLLFGCGAKSSPTFENGYSSDEQSDHLQGDKDEDGSYQPDKIIATISIEMQTKDFVITSEKLNSLIIKYKGYIQNSNISFNDYVYGSSLKHSNYSIRIPRESLDNFVDEVVTIGNIISNNKNKQDITVQYKDTESRLKVLEIKEERILALLERAEKIEDIIVLENQLSDVIYQKETLTQSLTDMDDRVNYSTVNLNLSEVAKLSSSGNITTPFVEKLQSAFEDSFYFFTRNIGRLIIAFIYLLPYALVLGLILIIAYRFGWKNRNKSFKRFKEKNNQNNDEGLPVV